MTGPRTPWQLVAEQDKGVPGQLTYSRLALWWLTEAPQQDWDLSLTTANVVSFIKISGSLLNLPTLESVWSAKKCQGVWHQKKLSATVWQPPLRHVQLQHQWTTYWHMPYFGRHLTYLFLMTPQGFGYQTFLDWRACPCHTAHKPGERDCSRLGLWIDRSLSLCSGKCHTAGTLNLTIHQQAPGKLLWISSAGEHGQRTSFMQTILRAAPNLLSPGAGEAGSVFQSECCGALKRFLFYLFLSRLEHATVFLLFL